MTRRARGLVAGGLLGAATIVASGACADIGIVRSGPFEVCLDSAYDAWLKAQAELQVKEDRQAKSLDDAAAAAWTAATLDACRKKGTAEAGSDSLFARYTARWREHVFDLATSIRKIGQSD